MITVPTLLVGLGGIGSLVVDRVYGMIPPEERNLVAIHAFDTNVNDISKLSYLKEDRVTQTSKAWTVETYLNSAESSLKLKDWFPHEFPEILKKTLTDGAGQIRSVSRLAYYAAMEDGKLGNLHAQINELKRQTGSKFDTNVRVMIVSSLAGGTGAGIFLQTAMFLRELLKSRVKNCLVRGAFILPDTLINTNVLEKKEAENVRANAYACLKELNAVMMTTRTGGARKFATIEFEYRPNQRDEQGRPDLTLGADVVPYDFAFMFDFENISGHNIGSFDNYLDQTVKTTYLQLFSPVRNDLFSQEDNQIQAHISEEGKNRFCGAGVALLIYPYADIVEYCALNWACDSLSTKWLKIDELYEGEVKQYQRDVRDGLTRERPKLSERFPRLLQSLATGEKPDPFFRRIHNTTYTIGEKGQPGAPKHLLLREAVEREVSRLCQTEAAINENLPDFQLDQGKIKVKEKARNEIISFESNLLDLREKTFKFVDENSHFIVNRVLFQDADEPAAVSGEECRLNSWILKMPEALHPVAVRYFLYSLCNDLDEKLQSLAPKAQELRDGILRYEAAYDLPNTEGVIENAEDRLKIALSQNMLTSLLKSQYKVFIGEYLAKSSQQLRRIIDYRVTKLQEKVFTEMRRHVGEMLDDWENYFRNLSETNYKLLGEANLIAVKHDKSDNPTTVFVLATKPEKEKIWQEASVTLAGEEIPEQICREIYVGQYRRYCANHRGERNRDSQGKTEEIFRRDVVGWCRKQLLKFDTLDLDIVRALEREAELHAPELEEFDNHLRQRITALANLAKPFVPDVPGAMLRPMRFWGVNPRGNSRLPDSTKNHLFGPDLLVDEGFAPHELICYNSVYGLKAEDFDKFSAGVEGVKPPGAYYLAYRERIKRMNETGRFVSPHLDKRWHLPAYMPDLNERQDEQDAKRIDQAFILGMIYGFLDITNDSGKDIWVYYGEGGGSQAVKVLGKTAKGVPHLLHEALRYNPVIFDKVLARVGERRESDRRNFPDEKELPKHKFCDGSSSVNIFEKIFTYPTGDPGNASLVETVTERLMPLLLNEIENYFSFVFGLHRDTMAQKAAADYIESLVQASPAFSMADKRTRYCQDWERFLQERLRTLRG